MLRTFRPTPITVAVTTLLALGLLALSYVLQSSWWNARFADYWAYGFPLHF